MEATAVDVHARGVADAPDDEIDWTKAGARLHARREELKIGQSELADRIGVRPHSIWRYENGKGGKWGPDVLLKLSRELRVTERWLLTGESAEEEVERDEDLGPPGMEAYFSKMAARGTPVPGYIRREMRDSARATGPDVVTEGYAALMHQQLVAKHASRALERPAIEDAPDEARGQRRMPIRRKKT